MRPMNAWEPIAQKGALGDALGDAPAQAAFHLQRAASDGQPPPTPLVFASPHSGRWYPDDMMAASALDAQTIRRSEDALAADLIAPPPHLAAPLLTAPYPPAP